MEHSIGLRKKVVICGKKVVNFAEKSSMDMGNCGQIFREIAGKSPRNSEEISREIAGKFPGNLTLLQAGQTGASAPGNSE